MRIAIVTDWFPPRRGGIETQLRELAGRLARSGNDVDVITATPGAAGDGTFNVTQLDLLHWPDPPFAISPNLLSAVRQALARKPDVVHAHVSVISPVGWAGALAGRTLGVPVSVTFHSILRGKELVLRAMHLLGGLGRAPIAWSAVSSTVAAQASRGLGGARVNVLPNGIELDSWDGRARPARAGAIELVAAMRLQRKKRGRHLIRAFARAARGSNCEARLRIAGDGPERDALERERVRLGLVEGRARVEFLGWQDAATLAELYTRSDGFVMASVHESLGIAALEARAAGLPVIARRSGNTDFLAHGRNALLADSDDQLAGHMRAYLADASLRRRLANARDSLAAYGWQAVLEAHVSEYQRATHLAGWPT